MHKRRRMQGDREIRDLRAVSKIVNLRQGMHETPYAGSNQMQNRTTYCNRPGQRIGNLSPAVFDIIHCIKEH